MANPVGSAKAFAQAGRERGFETIQSGGEGAPLAINSTGTTYQFGTSTTIARLFATADCYIAFGSGVITVTNSSYFLPGGFIDFVGVTAFTNITARTTGTSGILYLTGGAS